MPLRPALALFIALLACSASAQEQTVESAMDFLSEVLVGQRYNPNLWTTREGDPVDLPDRWGALVEVGAGERCSVEFKAKMPAAKLGNREWSAHERNAQWKFGHVFEIQKKGATDLTMAYQGREKPLLFRLNSESLRDRVAYAMEYLRVNCDAMRRTGF